jgi:hypothetical protein
MKPEERPCEACVYDRCWTCHANRRAHRQEPPFGESNSPQHEFVEDPHHALIARLRAELVSSKSREWPEAHDRLRAEVEELRDHGRSQDAVMKDLDERVMRFRAEARRVLTDEGR